MAARALVIGIDDYAFQPLSSAVNDANAFAAALVEHGLAAQSEITLLTSPGTGATFDQIFQAVRDVYRRGGGLDRFFFFFAGHGLLAFSNSAQTRTRTALVAADVRVLDDDGRKLLDFGELLDLLELAGPKEQFYFVDACRDLCYEKQPDVGSLGLAGEKPGAARAQAALFAVSPLGQAVSVKGGMGVMTTHLLEALRGEGVAKEIDPATDEWVVTVQSAHDYIQSKVLARIEGLPMWTRRYIVPELHVRGPRPAPLRVLQDVPDEPLTIHIEPDAVAAQTHVELALRRVVLQDMCLPPRRNHETLRLPPQRYSMKVKCAAGAAVPERDVIDVRTTRELHVRVSGAGMPMDFEDMPDPRREAAPSILSTPALPAQSRKVVSLEGTIAVESIEEAAVIRVVGLDPPHLVREGRRRLEATLPAGPYRVTFRLGTDVFGVKDVYLLSGERVDVRPSPLGSDFVRESFGATVYDGSVMPSESIGPMQGAVLPTLLPVLGLKPFDPGDTFFGRATPLIPLIDPHTLGMRPVSVVVALEGDWDVDFGDALEALEVRLLGAFGGSALAPPVRLQPLGRAPGAATFQAGGFGRVGLATFRAPSSSFVLQIRSPELGALSMALANLDRRVTVVGLTLRADGSFELGQNLLRLPGEHYDEPDPYVPYPRVIRQLQCGQKLYASGELGEIGPTLDVVRDVLYAKWTDPILGCMGYHAWRRRNEDPGLRAVVAANLSRYFPALPDARVIAALEGLADPSCEPALGLPILAESVRASADLDAGVWPDLAELRQLSRRLDPNQPWTCFWH